MKWELLEVHGIDLGDHMREDWAIICIEAGEKKVESRAWFGP